MPGLWLREGQREPGVTQRTSPAGGEVGAVWEDARCRAGFVSDHGIVRTPPQGTGA